MGEFFSRLLDLYINGDKKAFSRIMVIVLIGLITIPFCLNYFYGNIRLKQQIQLLEELNNINKSEIKDLKLKEYYESIVNGLVKTKPQTNIFYYEIEKPRTFIDFIKPMNILKFISGSFWFLILFVTSLFTKQDTIKEKILLIISMFIMTVLFGIGGVYLPTFEPFVINLIGFPYLQLFLFVLIAFLIIKLGKNPKEEKSEKI